jgi:hypothetical protein
MPTADVWIELSAGSGTVRLRLDWTAGVGNGNGHHHLGLGHGKSRNRAASIKAGSIRGSSEGPTPESPSRFSLKRNKTKEKE